MGASATDTGRIRRYLEGRREAMRLLLEELVALESPSDHPERQGAVLDVLESELRRLGHRTRRAGPGDRDAVLLGRPAGRRGRPWQLLVGHADTVWPLGTLDEMPVGVPHEDPNALRGPGAYDMKAGLVGIVFALDALGALELEPSVTPVVFVNTDEEIGSRGSTRYLRALARNADRAFVLEPSLGPEGRLKTARKGVGKFHVTVMGRAAHAGLEPGEGASAILELSHVIQKLFALNDPERGLSVNVGVIDGGLRPNVVAPRSSAVVDVRVASAEDARRVEDAIRGLKAVTPGVRVEVTGGIGRPPMEPTPANRRLWRLAASLADSLGAPVDEGTAGGGSDGNTTSLYTATLDGLGAVGGGAHAAHEFVRIDRMPERCALLALLLLAPALRAPPHGGHAMEPGAVDDRPETEDSTVEEVP